MENKALERPIKTESDLAQYIIYRYLTYLDSIIETFYDRFDYLRGKAKHPESIKPEETKELTKGAWLFDEASKINSDITSFIKTAPDSLSSMVKCGIISEKQHEKLFSQPIQGRLAALDRLTKKIYGFSLDVDYLT